MTWLMLGQTSILFIWKQQVRASQNRYRPQSAMWDSQGFIKGLVFMPTGANIQLTCAKQSEKSQEQFYCKTVGAWLHVRASCKLFSPAESPPANKDLVWLERF